MCARTTILCWVIALHPLHTTVSFRFIIFLFLLVHFHFLPLENRGGTGCANAQGLWTGSANPRVVRIGHPHTFIWHNVCYLGRLVVPHRLVQRQQGQLRQTVARAASHAAGGYDPTPHTVHIQLAHSRSCSLTHSFTHSLSFDTMQEIIQSPEAKQVGCC